MDFAAGRVQGRFGLGHIQGPLPSLSPRPPGAGGVSWRCLHRPAQSGRVPRLRRDRKHRFGHQIGHQAIGRVARRDRLGDRKGGAACTGCWGSAGSCPGTTGSAAEEQQRERLRQRPGRYRRTVEAAAGRLVPAFAGWRTAVLVSDFRRGRGRNRGFSSDRGVVRDRVEVQADRRWRRLDEVSARQDQAAYRLLARRLEWRIRRGLRQSRSWPC